MRLFVMGWMMGLEPTNAGTTNRCVNHFATPTIRIFVIGAPGEIRTPDNLLRRQMLYPTELQAPVLGLRLSTQVTLSTEEGWENHGRGRGIRTPGLLVPNQAR